MSFVPSAVAYIAAVIVRAGGQVVVVVGATLAVLALGALSALTAVFLVALAAVASGTGVVVVVGAALDTIAAVAAQIFGLAVVHDRGGPGLRYLRDMTSGRGECENNDWRKQHNDEHTSVVQQQGKNNRQVVAHRPLRKASRIAAKS